ncbi:TolC family protein, partial [Polaromonas sp.]|uniref:TolC family protein n=1 Tax=Polaromonas sp. TaxID=1869339 RepID=UPI0025DDBFCC
MPTHSLPRLAPLALTLAALLSGCASITSSTQALPETPVPAEWSVSAPYAPATADALSLAAWWQGFNDPQLTALVTRALQANTDIRTAQAALQQARALRDVSAAGLAPRVDTSASAQRSKSGGSQAGNLFQAGFDASWEPDVFGGRRSALNASDADVRAATASLGNVQVSLAAEVALAYLQLRGLQAQRLIAQGSLAAQRETLQLTRWRAQAGLASSLDVEQGIAASEQTAAQIPLLDTGIAQAASSLAVLTGQSPGVLRSALANAAPVPQAASDLALAIPAETLRQRPDVRAAVDRI